MTDSPELAAIRARDAARGDNNDRRTLLRMLDEARAENSQLMAESDAASDARMRISKIIAERDALAAESEARHQSCLVLMNSVTQYRTRVQALGAAIDHALRTGLLQKLREVMTSALETPVAQPLLRAASKPPPGCYCTARCAAPVIMGRQTPCRDPEKAARFPSCRMSNRFEAIGCAD